MSNFRRSVIAAATAVILCAEVGTTQETTRVVLGIDPAIPPTAAEGFDGVPGGVFTDGR